MRADFGEGCIDNILNVGVGCHEEWASGNVHAPIFDSNLVWITNGWRYVGHIVGPVTLVGNNGLAESISAASKT
jgi:hypothetical protein